MTEGNAAARDGVSRDFTVAVFVISDGRVLLHCHPKLGKWLPPGGHIEPNELPDDAAIREVMEETGLHVELVGSRGLPADYPDQPRQLIVPAGVQVEQIGPGHEHIDLVYFATIHNDVPNRLARRAEGFRWIALEEIHTIPVTDEVQAWCQRAIRELAP